MNTLLLDVDIWDVCLDASGNIAMAEEPYANAQDVASACRLFLAELYYDTTKGVPYFQQILGQYPPASLIKDAYVQAALTVPDIVQAQVVGLNIVDRKLTGTVEVINATGQTNNVSF